MTARSRTPRPAELCPISACCRLVVTNPLHVPRHTAAPSSRLLTPAQPLFRKPRSPAITSELCKEKRPRMNFCLLRSIQTSRPFAGQSSLPNQTFSSLENSSERTPSLPVCPDRWRACLDSITVVPASPVSDSAGSLSLSSCVSSAVFRLSPYLPISPSPHLPISPSPHLPISLPEIVFRYRSVEQICNHHRHL